MLRGKTNWSFEFLYLLHNEKEEKENFLLASAGQYTSVRIWMSFSI